jgi:hypothetical protein
VDGVPVLGQLSTGANNQFSEARQTWFGTGLSDGFLLRGSIQLDFNGNNPPNGSRLNMMINAGQFGCEGAQP